MEWVETTNSILALVVGLCGLIGTGIGTFFAIKNWIDACKEKSSKEIWNMIMVMATAAMKEAEASGATSGDKKQFVINMVKSSCKAAGVDIDDFLDQLSDYIDQCIKFVNDMNEINNQEETSADIQNEVNQDAEKN